MLDLQLGLLLVCFFLSGLAALIYETAWAQQLSFVFGTSELAVATVLASYMAGLGTGAAIIGRLNPRVRRPVLVYGLLELGIAISALLVPAGLRAASALYGVLFGGASGPPMEGGLASALFFLGASFAVLVVPTALMGATLPLLARHAVRSERDIGPRIGLLYATNTLGAVTGTILAAFALLPAFGLEWTVSVAVLTNVLVFAAAVGLARLGPPLRATPDQTLVQSGLRRFILPMIAVSGAVSFTYEVLWTRLLTHLIGGSIYAFATMLASFLLGIALGSAGASRLATSFRTATRGFAVAQMGIATLSLAAYHLLDALPGISRELAAARLPGMPSDALVAGLALLPPALCIGATFPFAVRIAARGAADAGPAAARVYAWNTAGAIVGSLGAAFIFLPELGIAGSLRLTLVASLALAGGAGLASRNRGITTVAAVALVVACLLPVQPPWALLRTGPFGRTPVEGPIDYFAVGRSATVILIRSDDGWFVRTNGMPEAFVLRQGARFGDQGAAQRWEGILPVLLRPDLESLLVVGLGGGAAIEAIPRTVRSIEVIEIEPEVIEANRTISAGRMADPLSDPRVHLVVNDARAALRLMSGQVDAITSQPSYPWTGGASHMYTREFFTLARDRLPNDGLLVQWMGTQFLDEELLRSMVATLLTVFPHVQLWLPTASSAALFVASQAPLDVLESAPRALAADPSLFARFGLTTVEDVFAALAVDVSDARRFAADAPVIRDGRNLLAMRSSRLKDEGLRYRDVWSLVGNRDPLVLAGRALDPARSMRALLRREDIARAQRLVPRVAPGAERHVAAGLLATARNQRGDATWQLNRALELSRGSEEARAAWLMLNRQSIGDGSSALPFGDLTSTEAAIVDGWRAAAAGNPSAARDAEDILASIEPGHPLYEPALRQRVGWRIAAGNPRLAEEALPMTDLLLSIANEPDDYLLRARAARQAGAFEALLMSLEGWANAAAHFRGTPLARRADDATTALESLASSPIPGDYTRWRDRVAKRLEAYGPTRDPNGGPRDVPVRAEQESR